MENTTESRETFAASNPTPQGQDGSSLNAAFDVDAFVHASGDGFGNTAPLRSDTGAIDMDAISQVIFSFAVHTGFTSIVVFQSPSGQPVC